MDYIDGKWYAETIGSFVGMLVDSGDVAICFRVTKDSEMDENGKFIRRFEVLLLPDGFVANAMHGCHRVHRLLQEFLENEIVR